MSTTSFLADWIEVSYFCLELLLQRVCWFHKNDVMCLRHAHRISMVTCWVNAGFCYIVEYTACVDMWGESLLWWPAAAFEKTVFVIFVKLRLLKEKEWIKNECEKQQSFWSPITEGVTKKFTFPITQKHKEANCRWCQSTKTMDQNVKEVFAMQSLYVINLIFFFFSPPDFWFIHGADDLLLEILSLTFTLTIYWQYNGGGEPVLVSNKFCGQPCERISWHSPHCLPLWSCFLTTRSGADTWWTPTPLIGSTDLVRLLPRLN